MKIQAQVIAHSKNLFNDELITFVVTFPRIILAEAKTHRLLSQDGSTILEEDISLNIEQSFSRNSASSRAIPTNKMIQSLRENPFVPIAWQKEHKGMQGTEYITDPKAIKIEVDNWMEDLRYDLASAERRLSRGVTKQIANRQLESFMWHTVIITTGKEGLENFFNLRCPKYELNLGDSKEYYRSYKNWEDRYNKIDRANEYNIIPSNNIEQLKINKGKAEIHMMALAEAMYDAYNESTPELLKAGEWHIPYKKEIEELWDKTNLWCWDSEDSVPNIAYISSVMCARVSFTVAGHELSKWTLEKYLDKAHELANADPLHASPFEHAAPAMSERQYYSFVKGMYPTIIEKDGTIVLRELYPNTYNRYICQDIFGWCRNYRGFIQLRHILEERANRH